MKRPGLVTVSVGEPLDPREFEPQALNARVEEWIAGELQRLRAATGDQ
jgi:1-acyl-sn-glycerol-3-phosphate acyltransferase